MNASGANEPADELARQKARADALEARCIERGRRVAELEAELGRTRRHVDSLETRLRVVQGKVRTASGILAEILGHW